MLALDFSKLIRVTKPEEIARAMKLGFKLYVVSGHSLEKITPLHSRTFGDYALKIAVKDNYDLILSQDELTPSRSPVAFYMNQKDFEKLYNTVWKCYTQIGASLEYLGELTDENN